MQRPDHSSVHRGRELPASPDTERIARLYALAKSVNTAIAIYRAERAAYARPESFACPISICLPIGNAECDSCSVAVPC